MTGPVPPTAFLLGIRRGEIRTGRVAEVRNFGVFVDIDGEPAPGRTGFVPVPELSWYHIDDPSDVVEVGQRITAEVLDVDTQRGQVTLSLRAVQDDPMVSLEGRVGEVVRGPVTKVFPFGAFVRVAEGFEGLVRWSARPDDPTALREQIVEVGAQLSVRILQVDRRHRRILMGPADADHRSGQSPPG